MWWSRVCADNKKLSSRRFEAESKQENNEDDLLNQFCCSGQKMSYFWVLSRSDESWNVWIAVSEFQGNFVIVFNEILVHFLHVEKFLLITKNHRIAKQAKQMRGEVLMQIELCKIMEFIIVGMEMKKVCGQNLDLCKITTAMTIANRVHWFTNETFPWRRHTQLRKIVADAELYFHCFVINRKVLLFVILYAPASARDTFN